MICYGQGKITTIVERGWIGCFDIWPHYILFPTVIPEFSVCGHYCTEL